MERTSNILFLLVVKILVPKWMVTDKIKAEKCRNLLLIQLNVD